MTQITVLLPCDTGEFHVVVGDFEGESQSRPIWFESFDAFMRSLRRLGE